MSTRLVLVGAFVSCLALLLGGCGGSGGGDQPKLVPVTGVITLDGKPASNVIVNFVPAAGTRGDGGNALTDASGAYALKTRGTHQGVAAGGYKVTCEKYVMPDGSDYDLTKGPPHEAGAKQIVPAESSDREQTKLTATVPAEGGKFNFDLKSK